MLLRHNLDFVLNKVVKSIFLFVLIFSSTSVFSVVQKDGTSSTELSEQKEPNKKSSKKPFLIGSGLIIAAILGGGFLFDKYYLSQQENNTQNTQAPKSIFGVQNMEELSAEDKKFVVDFENFVVEALLFETPEIFSQHNFTVVDVPADEEKKVLTKVYSYNNFKFIFSLITAQSQPLTIPTGVSEVKIFYAPAKLDKLHLPCIIKSLVNSARILFDDNNEINDCCARMFEKLLAKMIKSKSDVDKLMLDNSVFTWNPKEIKPETIKPKDLFGSSFGSDLTPQAWFNLVCDDLNPCKGVLTVVLKDENEYPTTATFSMRIFAYFLPEYIQSLNFYQKLR